MSSFFSHQLGIVRLQLQMLDLQLAKGWEGEEDPDWVKRDASGRFSKNASKSSVSKTPEESTTDPISPSADSGKTIAAGSKALEAADNINENYSIELANEMFGNRAQQLRDAAAKRLEKINKNVAKGLRENPFKAAGGDISEILKGRNIGKNSKKLAKDIGTMFGYAAEKYTEELNKLADQEGVEAETTLGRTMGVAMAMSSYFAGTVGVDIALGMIQGQAPAKIAAGAAAGVVAQIGVDRAMDMAGVDDPFMRWEGEILSVMAASYAMGHGIKAVQKRKKATRKSRVNPTRGNLKDKDVKDAFSGNAKNPWEDIMRTATDDREFNKMMREMAPPDPYRKAVKEAIETGDYKNEFADLIKEGEPTNVWQELIQDAMKENPNFENQWTKMVREMRESGVLEQLDKEVKDLFAANPALKDAADSLTKVADSLRKRDFESVIKEIEKAIDGATGYDGGPVPADLLKEVEKEQAKTASFFKAIANGDIKDPYHEIIQDQAKVLADSNEKVRKLLEKTSEANPDWHKEALAEQARIKKMVEDAAKSVEKTSDQNPGGARRLMNILNRLKK